MSKPIIDHIGIATNSIEDATIFWEALGLVAKADDVNQEQGVRIRMMKGNSNSPKVELLEPLGPETPVGRFISKRGEGMQQLAFSVDDITETIDRLIESGCRMINEEPTNGVDGSLIAFVHPSSTGGVLVELVQHNS
tara:strand:- start:21194 stop:21604 length:411 start_codon:yes stop_codon:yes gene_type:complete